MAKPSLLLLDTHAWIWLMNGDKGKFSTASRKAIEQASRRAELRVSVMSVWEVAMLEAKGRLKLSQSCDDWVGAALTAPGVSLVPLSSDAAIESSRLPGGFHGDPVDRILVATARQLGATLVTQDDKIIQYGKQHYVSVMPMLSRA
ncbi:MAG: type II toxin-antitoxin system VapC family toxin [Gammaproteobacteria bacterium]